MKSLKCNEKLSQRTLYFSVMREFTLARSPTNVAPVLKSLLRAWPSPPRKNIFKSRVCGKAFRDNMTMLVHQEGHRGENCISAMSVGKPLGRARLSSVTKKCTQKRSPLLNQVQKSCRGSSSLLGTVDKPCQCRAGGKAFMEFNLHWTSENSHWRKILSLHEAWHSAC